MDICVIGAGHVGLVTGACFADLGNNVICVDNDVKKIGTLKKGVLPIYEPGLEEMVHRNVREGRLSFTVDVRAATRKSTVIFIAVGTPPKENGEADLSAIEDVTRKIARAMHSYHLIVEKSTVPIATGKWIEYTAKEFKTKRSQFDVACNPEFLREGQAIEDFMRPDRIVIGVGSKKAKDILTELYRPIKAPVVVTDINSAELIKHASNSFLATKISFINAVSNICERADADILKVAEGMGMDKRIGRSFLDAGLGFGGFCFPKDLAAFIKIAGKLGYDFGLLKEVEKINDLQKKGILKKAERLAQGLEGKTIGVLGLSFKPDTDDIRFSPPLDVIKDLLDGGAAVKAYDPQAMPKAKKVMKGIRYCSQPYEAANGADCLIVATEWNEFKELDFRKIKGLMRHPAIVDCRNIYDPAEMKRLGFKYAGVGRK